MPLQNVSDEIEHGNPHTKEPILKPVEEMVQSDSIDEEEEINVPETQFPWVVNDDEFDEVVQKDLQVAKKLRENMTESEMPFTLYVSKHQKKKNQKTTRSASQPYQTRSNGASSHMSL
ncbi:hypothetical protein A2U01_0047134 [Trifolium medium]|uniref:Uncharacterized protein n=1 Tax=Trifolium medium TaxID=97028 RepID=A0A392QNG5_9FABA|nr:hypothetical protein [Trifolium medium]